MESTGTRTPDAPPAPGDSRGVRGRVLVVDDEEGIRSMLSDVLGATGHEVATAADGREALAAVEAAPPDVVLLDIHLPGMKGTEILARLKAHPLHGDVPVIMITAYHDVVIAERCLRAGAEDYVQKPFKMELLRARVEGCIARRLLRRREADMRALLERSNRALEEAVKERTRELVEANGRLANLDRAKDDFLALIAHELRTPVTGLQAAGQILVEGGLTEEERRELAGILQSSLERLGRLLEDALALTRLKVEGGVPASTAWPLGSILRDAADEAAVYARERGVFLGPVPPTPVLVACDPALVQHAFEALLEGGARFCGPQGRVETAVEAREESVVVRVRAPGDPLPREVVDRLLGIFSVVESVTPGGDLGLGLPLASRILHLFGGSVEVVSPEGGGVLFTVRLPLAAEYG